MLMLTNNYTILNYSMWSNISKYFISNRKSEKEATLVCVVSKVAESTTQWDPRNRINIQLTV